VADIGCPKGHVMYLESHASKRECDLCGRRLVAGNVHPKCSDCNYDLCANCAARQHWYFPSPPRKEAVTTLFVCVCDLYCDCLFACCKNMVWLAARLGFAAAGIAPAGGGAAPAAAATLSTADLICALIVLVYVVAATLSSVADPICALIVLVVAATLRIEPT